LIYYSFFSEKFYFPRFRNFYGLYLYYKFSNHSSNKARVYNTAIGGMWACNAFCSYIDYHYLSISEVFVNKCRTVCVCVFSPGDVTLCRTANVCRRFWRLWRLHLQSSNKKIVLWQLVLEVLGIIIIRNFGSNLPPDKALTTHTTVPLSNLATRWTYTGLFISPWNILKIRNK